MELIPGLELELHDDEGGGWLRLVYTQLESKETGKFHIFKSVYRNGWSHEEDVATWDMSRCAEKGTHCEWPAAKPRVKRPPPVSVEAPPPARRARRRFAGRSPTAVAARRSPAAVAETSPPRYIAPPAYPRRTHDIMELRPVAVPPPRQSYARPAGAARSDEEEARSDEEERPPLKRASQLRDLRDKEQAATLKRARVKQEGAEEARDDAQDLVNPLTLTVDKLQTKLDKALALASAHGADPAVVNAIRDE